MVLCQSAIFRSALATHPTPQRLRRLLRAPYAPMGACASSYSSPTVVLMPSSAWVVLTCRSLSKMPQWPPLCTEPNTPFPSVPIRRCPRCPSGSLCDRAIHTVPIMPSNQQVHIGSGQSRPTLTDRTFRHCRMQLLVLYPMEGTKNHGKIALCSAQPTLT